MMERDGIRKRPSMYIGDTRTRGLHHLLFELIDNVADQFLAGTASEVSVQADENSILVSDDGPGLPFDEKAESGVPLATEYLTTIHRRATADAHTPHLHFAGFGCGLSVLTALSEQTTIRSWRNGRRWELTFCRGEPAGQAIVIESGEGRGTTIQFRPDPGIFGDYWIDESELDAQLKVVSHLLPGFRVMFNGNLLYSQNGLADWCSEFADSESSSPMSVQMKLDDFEVQAAAIGSAEETKWISFANGNRTVEGGTHLTAFKQVINRFGWKPAVAMIHVTLHSPEFAGPTRARLVAPKIQTPIEQALGDIVRDYCRMNFGI